MVILQNHALRMVSSHFWICLILCAATRSAEARLPVLVQRQPPAIQQAWREIEQVLHDNESLAQPLPEPYLARGDLWTRIGGHEDALADYLKATELFFQSNPTPGEQARHLARLRTSLESVVNQPRPHFPSDAATEFDQGLSAFRSGDYSTAEINFTECTRLMSEEPLYRVYRALAHHQLNHSDTASRQVAIALSLVRAKGADAADQMSQIQRGLEPVQGPMRVWLAAEMDRASKQPSKTSQSIRR